MTLDLILAFVFGLVCGGVIGLFAMAAVSAGSREDDCRRCRMAMTYRIPSVLEQPQSGPQEKPKSSNRGASC